MNDDFTFELDSETVEKLGTFSELLQKDASTMLREALNDYFEKEEKRLLEKSRADKDHMTNLDYDEFWDGVDL